MIAASATLSIKRIPLDCLQVKEYQVRYLEKLADYIDVMRTQEGDAGLLHVTPSDTHPGMYALLDGHTRFCAAIMAGRVDALCVVIEGNGNG